MPINPINQAPPKRSGGMWGKVGGMIGTGVGTIAGAIAAPFTAGTSIPAGMAAGGAAGGLIGGTIGQLADPGKVTDQVQGPTAIESAVKNDPALQIGVLREGQRALKEIPMPLTDHETAHNTLEDAINTIRKRSTMGGV